jgi:hypothetical protein
MSGTDALKLMDENKAMREQLEQQRTAIHMNRQSVTLHVPVALEQLRKMAEEDGATRVVAFIQGLEMGAAMATHKEQS